MCTDILFKVKINVMNYKTTDMVYFFMARETVNQCYIFYPVELLQET